MRSETSTPLTRFWAKVAIDDESGCWNWTASKSTDGYGDFGYDGKVQRAHRVAYTMFVSPIPAGFEIDHLCRNRACVRPSHLEVVTHRENCQRGQLGGHARENTHCSNGHPWTEFNTYANPKTGHRSCRTCHAAWARDRRRRKREEATATP